MVHDLIKKGIDPMATASKAEAGGKTVKKTYSEGLIIEGLSREEVEERLVTSIGRNRTDGWHYSCTIGPLVDDEGNDYLINVFCK
jgi:hypothetical protein